VVAPARALAAGLLYARQFWPTFKKRQQLAELLRRALFFSRGPSRSALKLDGVSPFERIRTLDPPADPALVRHGLSRLATTYPALANLQVAASWGGLIDSTPDGIPVISAVDPLPASTCRPLQRARFGIGPAAGQLAADLIAGDPPIVDPHPSATAG